MNVLLSHLVAGVAGFVGGLAVAHWIRVAHLTRADTLRALTGLLVVMLVGWAVLSTYRAAADLAELAACEQTRNTRFAAALEQRAEATTAGNAAQREFLAALADPDITPGARAAAFEAYLAALDRIDAARAAAPLVVEGCGS